MEILVVAFFFWGGVVVIPVSENFMGIFMTLEILAEKTKRPTFTSQRLLQFDTGIASLAAEFFWKKSSTKNWNHKKQSLEKRLDIYRLPNIWLF